MDFIAFDLETTGIQPKNDSIIEVGAVRFSNGNPVDTYCTLINPGRPIPPEASAVNGITDEMVANQPDIKTALEKLTAFCGELPLVAHNAPFDFKFLLAVVEKQQLSAPKGIVLDTCALARIVFPGMLNYKLGTLVRHFGFPAGTFHRAEEDSVYCGRLFLRITEALEKAGQSASVPALLDLMKQPAMKFPQYSKRPQQLGLF
ncbi:MAG: 3'-5' exonuclease [Kiritimatiellaceae bacterium]|nr:3'-5' exonuclease [Kiritimatiellaceae bacterium]